VAVVVMVVVVTVAAVVVVRQTPHNIGHCFITSWPYSGLVQSSCLTPAHSVSSSQFSSWVVVVVVVVVATANCWNISTAATNSHR
jgi:hypothetical protein